VEAAGWREAGEGDSKYVQGAEEDRSEAQVALQAEANKVEAKQVVKGGKRKFRGRRDRGEQWRKRLGVN